MKGNGAVLGDHCFRLINAWKVIKQGYIHIRAGSQEEMFVLSSHA